ncbi:MAG: preprotein translocase subunit SecG [Treponema sp.]
MGIVGIVLLIAFVIICVLLVLLVLIQDDGNSGMGGLLGGRGTAAFGSHSAGVLTKATAVFVSLFFVVAFILAVINKKPKAEDDLAPTAAVEKIESAENEVKETAEKTADSWWKASDKTEKTE